MLLLLSFMEYKFYILGIRKHMLSPLSHSLGISKNKTVLFIASKTTRPRPTQPDFLLQGGYMHQVDVQALPPLYVERQEDAKRIIAEVVNIVVQVEKVSH